MRTTIKGRDVLKLAAILRGGATWEQAASALPCRIAPSVLERWHAHIQALANEPGAIEWLPVQSAPVDESAELEGWRESLRARAATGTIRSAGGRRP